MIESLLLRDFRSHDDSKVNFCPGLNIFLGEVGAGKTSILEAVSFALFGKYSSSLSQNELIRRGSKEAKIILVFSILQLPLLSLEAVTYQTATGWRLAAEFFLLWHGINVVIALVYPIVLFFGYLIYDIWLGHYSKAGVEKGTLTKVAFFHAVFKLLGLAVISCSILLYALTIKINPTTPFIKENFISIQMLFFFWIILFVSSFFLFAYTKLRKR